MVDLVKIRKKAKAAAGGQLPAAGDQLPVAGDQLPVAGGQLPVAGDQLPVAGGQLPVADGVQSEQLGAQPATEVAQAEQLSAAPKPEDDPPPSPHDPPATGNRQPATETGNQPPATDHQQPSTETKLDRFRASAGQSLGTESAVESAAENATELELLTFVIAGEQYAVAIERIVEIVTPRPITRIPNADPSVVGIISLRGAIVTLVDVRRKLRHPTGATSAPDPRIVVIEQSGETVGFQVDRVVRVIKLNRTAVEPHPVVHATEHDEAITGVFRQGNALTILLDLDKLLGTRALPGPVA